MISMRVISMNINNKIKVGFLVRRINNCGPINMVFELIKNLNKEQFEIMLISLSNSKTDYYKSVDKYCSLGIRHTGISQDELESVSCSLDIIHSHGLYPDLVVSKLKNNKVIKFTTIHCMIFKDYIQEYGYVKGIIGGVIHFYTLRYGGFNQIVACSESIKFYLKSYLTNKNISAINNGVDSGRFHPINNLEKIARKKEFGFNNKKVFIFCGRVIRRKQVPLLISQFIEKYYLDQNNILLILGDGDKDELDKCKKLADSFDRIILLGEKKHPEYYYQLADYVVSMSNSEGYPMSILEAVSCGCYALLSDIPSHREFINKNKEYASLFDNVNIYEINQKCNHDYSGLSSRKMSEAYAKLFFESKVY